MPVPSILRTTQDMHSFHNSARLWSADTEPCRMTVAPTSDLRKLKNLRFHRLIQINGEIPLGTQSPSSALNLYRAQASSSQAKGATKQN